MYTRFDKAIVAVVMAVILIVQKAFHISLGLDEDTVTEIIGALTPVLVLIFPNVPKDS